MAKPYGRIKIQENEDGKWLLGSGCKTCPVVACATATYRGSACASQRASYGLGDPMTNADKIRSMSDEELADFFILRDTMRKLYIEAEVYSCYSQSNLITNSESLTKITWLNWLKQPYEEDKWDQ